MIKNLSTLLSFKLRQVASSNHLFRFIFLINQYNFIVLADQKERSINIDLSLFLAFAGIAFIELHHYG